MRAKNVTGRLTVSSRFLGVRIMFRFLGRREQLSESAEVIGRARTLGRTMGRLGNVLGPPTLRENMLSKSAPPKQQGDTPGVFRNPTNQRKSSRFCPSLFAQQIHLKHRLYFYVFGTPKTVFCYRCTAKCTLKASSTQPYQKTSKVSPLHPAQSESRVTRTAPHAVVVASTHPTAYLLS